MQYEWSEWKSCKDRIIFVVLYNVYSPEQWATYYDLAFDKLFWNFLHVLFHRVFKRWQIQIPINN